MHSKGIVYVATGMRFVEEALLSIRSVKRHMPDVPVTLFTDRSKLQDSPPQGVDTVILIHDVVNSCRDKIKPLVQTPYEKTLFLDTDTYLCAPVYDIFDMLDRFDIALAQAPDRCQYDLPQLPDCFTELNSGVIAYRKSEQVNELLRQWEETFNQMLHDNADSYRDQHSLRYALFHSSVHFFVLPPEYNFRTICPNFAGKHCSVKILHGRHADLKKVALRLNRSKGARVFLTTPYRKFTKDIGTYESFLEASSNFIFQNLPSNLQGWLSAIRRRFLIH